MLYLQMLKTSLLFLLIQFFQLLISHLLLLLASIFLKTSILKHLPQFPKYEVDCLLVVIVDFLKTIYFT